MRELNESEVCDDGSFDRWSMLRLVGERTGVESDLVGVAWVSVVSSPFAVGGEGRWVSLATCEEADEPGIVGRVSGTLSVGVEESICVTVRGVSSLP